MSLSVLSSQHEAKFDEQAPLRVLCFDGGGFRGMASLLILDAIMRIISEKNGKPVKPCEYFDIITGTSTGGLIAIMLGRLRFTTEEAISKYRDCGAKAFGNVNSNKTWVAAGYPKVDAAPLEGLLQEIGRAGGQKDELLAEAANSVGRCRCFVTTTMANAPGAVPTLLRSYPSPITVPPYGHTWAIWEAARATSAAPVYFKPFTLKLGAASFTFSDAGAAGHNNPSAQTLNEIDRIRAFEGRPIGCFVSIGTGLSSLFQRIPKTHSRASGTFGKLTDFFKGIPHVAEMPGRLEDLMKYFTAVASNTQGIADDVHRRLSEKGYLPGEAYFRFDPPRGLQDYDLADITRGSDLEIATQDYVQSPDGYRQIQDCAKRLFDLTPATT